MTRAVDAPGRWASCLFLCCPLVGAALAAQPKPVELQWSELAPVITGHEIAIVLPEGARIKGEAVAVRPDALVMNIKKTSDKQAHPKGQASIPRSSVSTLRLKRPRSSGRVVGTVIGGLAGLIGGGVTAALTTNSVGPAVAVWVGITSATAIAGYYVGKGTDQGETAIKVVPDSP